MSLQNGNSDSNRLAIIDGLRGLAIFGVIYHHIFASFTRPGYKSFEFAGYELFPLTYLSNGWMGVNLFFFLSGFVLYLPYAAGQRSMRTQTLWGFYKRRAQRLMPLYYICAFVSVVFFAKTTADPGFIRSLILYLTVTFNFTPDEFRPVSNRVLWSLGVEIWFSILFPFIVIAIRRLGMYPVLMVSVVIALLVRIYGVDPEVSSNNPETLISPIKDSLLGRLDDFVLGMFCCYLCYVAKLKTLKSWQYGILFFAGLSLCTGACIIWDLVRVNKLEYGAVVYTNLLLNIGFCMVTFALLGTRTKLLRLITVWPLRIMGMMCYSLYVWHALVFVSIFSSRNWVMGWEAALTFYVYLFIVSALSYRYIEFGHVANIRGLFAVPTKKVKA